MANLGNLDPNFKPVIEIVMLISQFFAKVWVIPMLSRFCFQYITYTAHLRGRTYVELLSVDATEKNPVEHIMSKCVNKLKSSHLIHSIQLRALSKKFRLLRGQVGSLADQFT